MEPFQRVAAIWHARKAALLKLNQPAEDDLLRRHIFVFAK
jgi:hypothetical protein